MAAIDLYPHQEKAIGEIRNGSILKGGVGTGKTITALTYFYTKVCGGTLRINGEGDTNRVPRPRDIYVITTAKKRDDLDWEQEAAAFGISTHRDISVAGIQIKVDSWNNISNYEDVKDAFFVFDEQRLVGSGSWVKAFIKIAKANRWIMLSATPGDNWMDYVPIFVAHGFYKNRTEFLRRHVVWKPYSKFPKVDRYVETGHLLALRNRVLVEMPYERHTKRHVRNIITDYNQNRFDMAYKARWNEYEKAPIKDIAELFRVMRKIVNTDPSRVEAIKKLLGDHPRLIIFYNFNYELDSLRLMCDEMNYEYAEWNGQKHEAVPTSDSWVYLVQYTAGAEGWNCTSTDAIAFFSLNYSYKVTEQSKGRIDRLNTKYVDLYYYILRSNSVIDNAILKTLATKENFNERNFAKIGLPYADDFQRAVAA